MEYNKPFDLIENLGLLDCNCIYSEKLQPIFNLFGLVEEANNETKILLLCQMLETRGDNRNKSNEAISLIEYLKKTVKNSKLEQTEKESIIGGLENFKNESNSQKIRRLVEKYSNKTYSDFDKNRLIRTCYKLRSKIIHGEELNDDENNKIHLYSSNLKYLTLDIFKEWSKD